MAERGDLEFRGESFRTRVPGERGNLGRGPAVPRGEIEQEREFQEIREKHPFMRTVAQLAMVMGAATLLGRTIPRDAIRTALNALGQVGREGLTVARRGLAGVARGAVGPFPAYRGLERAFMGVDDPTLRNVELIGVLEDILHSRDGLHWTNGFARGLRPSQAGGPTRGFDQIMQEHLGNRFLRSHPSQSGLRHVTVGDVLASADLRHQLGQNQFNVLNRAHAAGLITDQMALTSHQGRVIGLFTDDIGRITDTRWAAPGAIGRGLYNIASNVSVLGFRPANLFLNLVQPFSRGEFFGELGVGSVIGRRRAIRAEDGLSFVVNGKIFRQAGQDAFQEIAGPRSKLFRVRQGEPTGNMEAFYALMGEHPLQRRVLASQDPAVRQARPFRTFWQQLQETIGMGPGYKTRPNVVEQYVIDPLRRQEALRRGGAYVPFMEGAVGAPQGVGFGYAARRHVRRNVVQQVMDNLNGLREDEGILIRPTTDTPGWNRRVLARTFGFDDPHEFDAVFGRETRGAVLDRAGAQEFQQTGVVRGAQRAIDRPVGRVGFPTRWARPGDIAEASMGRQTGRTTIRNFVMHDDMATSVSVLANNLTMRLNDLTSGLLNFGIRPMEGHFGAVVNLGRIYAGYKAIDWGTDYLGYADYLMEKYTGISPKKVALHGYVAARTGLQTMRELTGVRAGAEWLEDTFPGSIDSPLSIGLRTGAPIALTMFGRRVGGGIASRLAGVALGIFAGFGDMTKSSERINQELVGERDVEYRRGRWWMLGRQPFGGGQIEYFGPSWIARQLSDYRYTDSQYGSKDAYWQKIASTPTPSNLFGLLSEPEEYMTQKHYYTRPYPFDASGNPSRVAEMILDPGPVERDIIPSAPSRIGIPEYGNLVVPRVGSLYGPGGKMGHLADKISELGGIYKFALWDMPGFGEQTSPKIADASAMSSQAREYYDDQIGGMLGLTEAYRRFIPDEKWSRAYNTIPNMMPDWLPGIRSSFERDRGYYMDFTTGDPFTKVKHGEVRLPGPGYEVMHRLHSGHAGVYDAMDRFLVLADVAPYSDAFKQYKAIVSSWAKAGVLDVYWQDKFDIAQEQVKDKLEKYRFAPRRLTGLIDASEQEQMRVEKWNTIRKAASSAWEIFTHDVVSRVRDAVPLYGPILGDKLAPERSPIEAYKKWELYGEEFANWRKPWQSFIRPHMHELTAQDPATATFGGFMLGMFGSNPLSKLMISTAGAAAFGTASGVRALRTGQLTGGYVPEHRQEERDAKEYLDVLRYTKYRRLQEMAKAAGDSALAARYKSMAGRTVTGLDYEQPLNRYIQSARSALDKRERAYFDAFSMVSDPKARQEILSVVPEHIRPIYVAAWSKMGDPMARRGQREAQMAADQRAAAYWENQEAPPASWAGWHPSVSQSDIAIRLARQEGLDMHRFDLWEEQEVESRTRFDDLDVPVDMSNLRRRPAIHQAARQQRVRHGMRFTNQPWTGGFQAEGVSWDVIPNTTGEALRAAGALLEGM